LPRSGRFSQRIDAAFLLAANAPAGASMYAQYYCRDPGFVEPWNVGLSDALRFVVWP